jgi:hypothetical protein
VIDEALEDLLDLCWGSSFSWFVDLVGAAADNAPSDDDHDDHRTHARAGPKGVGARK